VSFYTDIGVRPLINAATTFTVLGGSLMPTEVLEAMSSASTAFVDMHELHERSGEELARLTHNEAAYVTAGCAAAIVLALLGSRTGEDTATIGRLLEGDQLPDEVIMHAAHRIPYDHAVRLATASIRQVGNVIQTFPWELEAAINERTLAVLYVAGNHLPPGALPLPDVVEIAHSHGIPVIVDAAAQLPPVENLWHFTRDIGADLALFSGGKALRGPQASGLMVGSASAVAAARAHGAPYQRLARAMKVGKEEVAGLVAAVRRYVALDHDALLQEWYSVANRWAQRIDELPGASAVVEHTGEAGQPVPLVRITIDEKKVSRTGESIVRLLQTGTPRLEVLPGGRDSFSISPDMLAPGEEETVESLLTKAILAR